MRGGIFISFEGIEGSGKTTQARLLRDYLKAKGYTVMLTKEPGGTRIGEKLRTLLLDAGHIEMDAVTELFLYAASRRQHTKELIIPGLDRGEVVITDRFIDSTKAYQGYARGIDILFIDSVNRAVTGGILPHLTLLLDVDVETGLRRNKAKQSDRIELEAAEFHSAVREGYLALQRENSGRIKLIDASGKPEETHKKVIEAVTAFLAKRGQ